MKHKAKQDKITNITVITNEAPVIQRKPYLEWFVNITRNRVVCAFDIETNTAQPRFVYPNQTESLHPSGLDPRVSNVTSIAATDGLNTFAVDAPTPGSTTLILSDPESAERAMVNAFAAWVQSRDLSYRVGIRLVGWNTTYFDVPFLIARGFNQFTVNTTDDDIPEPKYGYPEWSDLVHSSRQWNNAILGNCSIIDISHFFKDFAAKRGIKYSLKPVCQSLGIEMVEVNAEEMHLLTPAQVREYNMSDANGAWQLAKMIPDLFDAGEL